MPESDKNLDGMPLIDRIMCSGETLEASRREIAEEMRRLQSQNNIAGMQLLFRVYRDWEVRERNPEVSIEITEELAARNFDIVAIIADELKNTTTVHSAIVGAVRQGNKGGEITSFFRNAVGFEPPDERTDTFFDN